MIVTCDQCQTKFRIPDEKVTPKGVKVRCTKCRHTFKVMKEDVAASAEALTGQDDPFAKFRAPAGEGPPPPIFRSQVPSSAPVYDDAEVPTRIGVIPPELLAAARQGAVDATVGVPLSARSSAPPELPPQLPSLNRDGRVRSVMSAQPELGLGSAPPLMPELGLPSDDGLSAGGGGADLGLVPDQPEPGAFASPASLMPELEAPSLNEKLFGGEAPNDPPAPQFEPLPSAPPPEAGMAEAAPSGAVKLGRITLTKAAAPPSPKGQLPTVVRRVSGVAVNLVVAAVLLVVVFAAGTAYLNEGKLDRSALSYARLKALWGRSTTFVAVDVSNGLYDTRGGRPVFFMRGEVENRGARSAIVKVRAEIRDGEDLVRAAEGYAGATATPEELYSIDSAQELAALKQRLDARAKKIEPSARAPFLVVFYEYPPDLTTFRLNVALSDDSGDTTAAR